jgi:hypothetical protein
MAGSILQLLLVDEEGLSYGRPSLSPLVGVTSAISNQDWTALRTGQSPGHQLHSTWGERAGERREASFLQQG